jgi:hypothetical protein
MKDPKERIMTNTMRRAVFRPILSGLAAGVILATLPLLAGAAQAQRLPPSRRLPTKSPTFHRGLMVGETPNIDRIGQEGAIFMDYVAMQSCTSPSLPACIRCARD